MNSEYKGELMAADGKPMFNVKAIDWSVEYDKSTEMPPKFDFRELFEHPVVKVKGTLTSEGIGVLMGMLQFDNDREIVCCISKQRYWELMYLAQGKRYPKPRKRKSPMRMSKKVRKAE